MSGDELSQRPQCIHGFGQVSTSQGEASTSTLHLIIIRPELTPSFETTQEAPSTLPSNPFDHPEQIEMANNNHRLKELAAPNLDQQPLCI